MTNRVRSQLLRFAVLLIAAAVIGAYVLGRHDGRLLCAAGSANAQVDAEAQVKTDAVKTIARANRTGQAREADRAALDRFFTRLAEEARHDPPAPVDNAACVLPDDRLRRWAEANAGRADQGATATQPDDGPAAAAAPGLGPDGRPGGQPPPGGSQLSPAGQPAVPAAGAAGSGTP